MSESAKTLGQILVDIEANYGGYQWDFMSDSARQLVERTAKEFAKHIRSESASEIERLREDIKRIREWATNCGIKEADKNDAIDRLAVIKGLASDALSALSTPKESLPVEEVSR